MKFRIFAFSTLLISLFILNGCGCPCSGTTSTCPLPEKVASVDTVDLTVQ